MREVASPQTFGSVGRCIYCGVSEQLEEEHILAFALGGNWILPDASCRECAKITGRDEQLVLRGGLWAVRYYLELQSRTRPKPKIFKLHAVNGDESRSIDIEADDYPILLALPSYCGPLLLALPDSNPPVRPPWHRFLRVDPLMLLEKYGAEEYAPAAINAHAFARMLMKIAHGWAVVEFGLDGFEPFLPDLILGKQDDFLTFVGSTRIVQPARGNDHMIAVANFGTEPRRWIVAQINLFERFGAPGYRVIVGQRFGFPAVDFAIEQPPRDSPAYAERLRMQIRFAEESSCGDGCNELR